MQQLQGACRYVLPAVTRTQTRFLTTPWVVSEIELLELFVVKEAKYRKIVGCACQNREYGIKVTQ
jgi:hypothetical protein